jgi:hypothetical protein
MTPTVDLAQAEAAGALTERGLDGFDVNQVRNDDGEWATGGASNGTAAGMAAGEDRLGLAGRIQFGDGERLISSDRLAPTLDSDADLLFAVVDGPDGRELRISAGPYGDDSGVEWDGAGEFTARLDPRSLRRLRNDLDDAGRAAREAAKEADAAWDSGGQPDEKLYDRAVVDGHVGNVHYEMWLTDDEPTSWVTHLYTPSAGPPGETDDGVRLNPKDLRKLLARLGQVDTALTEAEAAALSGAMIALIPAESDAVRLAVDGGEPASELHCTLAYLGNAADLDAAKRQDVIDSATTAVNGLPIVDADVFALSVFNPGSTDHDPCLALGLTGGMLAAVHALIVGSLPHLPVQHAPWVPHITVQWGGGPSALAELTDRIGPARFDRLRIALGGQTIDVPLLAEENTEEDTDGFELPGGDWSLVETDGDGNNLRTYQRMAEAHHLEQPSGSAQPMAEAAGPVALVEAGQFLTF